VTQFRLSPRAYARITLVALAALVVIIITGAAVRLTGSGLGCPDWPTCANHRVVAPVSYHPLVEFTNRVFTGAVSVAVIVAVLGSLLRRPRRRDLTWLSLSLVLGVIVQAVLGGLAVLNKLKPEWVMAHFLTSMLLIWAALVLYSRARQPDGKPVAIMHRDYIILGRIMGGLAAVVIVIGTMVTGSGPHGGDEHVQRLGFKLHDITKVHGSFVWLLLAVTVLTLWRINAAHGSETLIKRGELVVAALLVQGAIGYFQYALGVPAGLVIFHIVGAVAVWLSVIWFNLAFFERYEDVGLAVYNGEEGQPLPELSA
jgi:heme a synthase